jgi:hypothetical protein
MKFINKTCKQSMMKILSTFVVLGSLLTTSSPGFALGLSTFRIYLDIDKRQDNFLVYSRDQYTQHCSLSLRHYNIKEDGGLMALDNDTTPAHSASKWIRFSPKKFSVKPGSVQAVKFKMRRKANIIPNEYRAYLSVDCIFDADELAANRDNKAQLTPRLRHNVPIIVRTGKLDATIRFDSIQLDKDSLSFAAHRTGNRSIHGKLQLVDKRSDKVLSDKSLFSLYTETPLKNVIFSTLGVEKEHLLLRFIEDPKVGGSIVFNQSIQ